MRTFTQRCEPEYSNERLVDVTDLVAEQVGAARVREGRVAVLSTDVENTLFVNENESGLRTDLERAFARLPAGMLPGGGSRSVVLPVVDERILLGDWQRILLHRRSPARRAELVVQVTGPDPGR